MEGRGTVSFSSILKTGPDRKKSSILVTTEKPRLLSPLLYSYKKVTHVKIQEINVR
jgi:hypothetical protein